MCNECSLFDMVGQNKVEIMNEISFLGSSGTNMDADNTKEYAL